ncbi:peptidase S24 [Flavobacteriaceae bacterium Ap0902]|nr:peptidase S24 [Flavobacteriaceae bacterium Ap0902]
MNLPDQNKRIKQLIDKFTNGSQNAFAEEIEVSQGTINRLFNVDLRYNKIPNASKATISKILKKYPKVNKDWLIFGKGEMLTNNTKPPAPKDDLAAAPLKGVTSVHLVQNTKAMAGWLDSYYADEYLEKLPIIEVPTENNHFGRYLAFKVVNDSMEPEYYEDDIVVGREVSRALWKSKLHIDDWDFIIAHNTEGVLIKEITEHNVETGDITLHSLNDFYKDQVVNLKDVTRIFSVADHRPNLRRRRLRRK